MCLAFYNTTKPFLSFENSFSLLSINSKYKIEIECIKSVVNYNHSKVMVCLYTSSGSLRSFIYDINEIDNFAFNENFGSYECKKIYFGLNSYYYRKNEEFVNSCIDLSGNLLVEFYDKDFNIYDYYIAPKTIKNNIYSILYSSCTQKYFIISERQAFVLLDGDKEELEEIKNNFDIQNCKVTDQEEKQESSIRLNNNQNSYENITEKNDNNPIIMKYVYQNRINNFVSDIQKGMLDTEIDDLINNEYEAVDYIKKIII